MAKEAIQAIFAAEKAAADLIAEAKLQAEEHSRTLASQAQDLSDQLWAEAEEKIEAMHEKAQVEARAKAQPLLDAAQKEAQRYQNLPPERVREAVDFVVKEVLTYGDR